MERRTAADFLHRKSGLSVPEVPDFRYRKSPGTTEPRPPDGERGSVGAVVRQAYGAPSGSTVGYVPTFAASRSAAKSPSPSRWSIAVSRLV